MVNFVEHHGRQREDKQLTLVHGHTADEDRKAGFANVVVVDG